MGFGSSSQKYAEENTQCRYVEFFVQYKSVTNILKLSPKFLSTTFVTNINIFILVKESGCNGDKRGIGNSRRLELTLFIQQSILAFHHLDDENEPKRPLHWVDRVDAMLCHFKGDHSKCAILER